MVNAIEGRPDIENDGLLEVGVGCRVGSRPLRSHLVIQRNARLVLGDNVLISYGAAISARASIVIGDNTRIGPLCLILDNDFHKVGQKDSQGEMAPIEIGRDVTLGARVTVLRGSRIGDGARVMSGSTVVGSVPANSVVAGVPARVGNPDLNRAITRSVTSTVMRTFALARPPNPTDGPEQISAWNEVGALRLLFALEETFGTTFPQHSVRAARSVAELSRVIASARPGELPAMMRS